MPPKAPPVADLGDPDRSLREAEERCDLAPVLPCALALREEMEHRIPRPDGGHRQTGLRLQEGVLHRTGGEPVADHVSGVGQRRRGVTATDDRRLEEVAPGVERGGPGIQGRKGVDDRLEHLVLDLDQGGRRAGLAARAGGHGRKHVPDVPRRLALGDEDRPVARDEADDPLAGTSAAVTTATTPGAVAARVVSIRSTRARGWSLKRIAPWIIPSTDMSATNGCSPRAMACPAIRSARAPTPRGRRHLGSPR